METGQLLAICPSSLYSCARHLTLLAPVGLYVIGSPCVAIESFFLISYARISVKAFKSLWRYRICISLHELIAICEYFIMWCIKMIICTFYDLVSPSFMFRSGTSLLFFCTIVPLYIFILANTNQIRMNLYDLIRTFKYELLSHSDVRVGCLF